MNIAIIDDERLWLDRIENVIGVLLRKKGIDSCRFYEGSSFEELAAFGKKIDFSIIDIELKGINGLSIVKNYRALRPECPVIVLTSHMEFSEFGYWLGVQRYINKANYEEMLQEAFESIYEKKEKKENQENQENQTFHFSKFGEKSISIAQVSYIETDKRGTFVHLMKGESLKCSDKISELEDTLPLSKFTRTHRCYLVNLDSVSDFDDTNVYLKSGSKINLSRKHKNSFLEAYWKYKYCRE